MKSGKNADLGSSKESDPVTDPQEAASSSPPVTASPSSDLPTDFNDVESAEKEEIAAQRRERLKDALHADLVHAPVGLALSGGGIRSATLSLGVLQWLCKPFGKKVCGCQGTVEKKGDLPLIEYVDYLSTVSGGGYMGSWFVANRRREAEAIAHNEQDEKGNPIAPNDFINRQGSPWLWHLRRFSRYLIPESGLMSADTWTAVVIWFRNTLLIQALVFSVVAFAFLLARYWGLAVMNGAPLIPAGIRGLGGAFMVPMFLILFVVARRVARELKFYEADDEIALEAQGNAQTTVATKGGTTATSDAKNDPVVSGKDKPGHKRKDQNKGRSDPKDAGGQEGVQWSIVLPTMLTGLILTFGMWWRHTGQVHSGEKVLKPLTVIGQSFFSGAWWAEWADGHKPASIIQDPAILLMCFGIGGLAWWLVTIAKNNSESADSSMKLIGPLVFAAVTLANFALMYMLDELFGWMLKEARLTSVALGLENGVDPSKVISSEGVKAMGTDMKLALGISLDMNLGAVYKGVSIQLGGALAAVIGPALTIFCYALVVITGIGIMGRRMSDKVREWWSRLGAWLIIGALTWLVLTSLAILSPLLVEWFRKVFSGWLSTGLISSWLAATVSAVLLGKSQKTNGSKDESKITLPLGLLTFVAVTGLLIGGAWLLRFMLTPNLDLGPSAFDPLLNDKLLSWPRHICFLVAIPVVGALLSWRVDLNEFSMNQFYRNRLVRCYLGGARKLGERTCHPFTGFDFKDDLPLRAFHRKHPRSMDFKGPYPLVCASLNTSQGGDLEVQERKAESFLFSPLYTGFSRRRILRQNNNESIQGYRPTLQYMTGSEAKNDDPTFFKDPSLSLGTVMSVSGAAASPNSGYHTSPLMAFLLTIFNARLGAWMPNPVRSRWWAKFTGALGGIGHLWAELFGSATPTSSFVYVSDGGHFENLALYELIRRKCKFIIVVDGEQDGDYTFHGLGTAIRRCRVDFDAEIQINVADIKPSSSSGWSASHGAVGKIIYHDLKPAEGASTSGRSKDLEDYEGVIVYLKSSLTGDEGTDVHQYKSLNPAFPHEPTGDQFFSESQFESYRELGHHMAREMFGAAFKRRETSRKEDLITFLRREMYERWSQPARAAAEAFVHHTDALDNLWAELGRPGMPACLTDLMMTDWEGFQTQVNKEIQIHQQSGQTSVSSADDTPQAMAAKLPDKVEEQSIAYAFCQRLIQLMENVYIDLHLDVEGDHMDNRGWMNLFHHWVSRPVMKAAWQHSRMTYGERFRKFWEDLECSAGQVVMGAGPKGAQPNPSPQPPSGEDPPPAPQK